ncbi:tRNA (adenosine(37)-N6)-dimethylallyltransferase MiaA [Deinococcus sp. Marseille-Q6407]|uniref:tRNA (adenosine(37)-N6)-dimethylallyltransferase MiaA n=1 Tax=Deinococcus sp. Marseille-Q6407 TaxID=2969223 RepID=UPI0021BF6008|nr:tRNA (adenosine(37)-N6)-dimethylallyltransferase MiaA [Deinococcus sp. Marseille-Q6407]
MLSPSTPALPVLTAPTAAGKSALALELAQEFGLDLISADAFTVYRGLDIGTAKPSRADRARVPHHLMDVAEVTESYDVARWVAAAEEVAAELLAQGRRPLVVGGTGFYLQALTQGLPLAPAADPAVRAQLESELQERGLDALLAEIAAVRPDQLPRMERNPRRAVRALEVFRRTGQFPADFGRRPPRFAAQVFAFSPPLPQLEAHITERTQALLQAGWPQEAQWLAEQVSAEARPLPTAWQALGYREALALARGELSLPQAAEAISTATRRYAKRQRTFLRTQLGAPLLEPDAARAALRAWLAERPQEWQG